MKKLLLSTAIVLACAGTALAQATVVTTDAPTTISVGTVAGQVINWIIAVAAVPVSAMIIGILYRVASGIGFSIEEARRARLQQLVVIGLHWAASSIAKDLDGKIPYAAKNVLMSRVLSYVQSHGADTLKALGYTPDGTAAETAITARVETALADPAVPVNVAAK